MPRSRRLANARPGPRQSTTAGSPTAGHRRRRAGRIDVAALAVEGDEQTAQPWPSLRAGPGTCGHRLQAGDAEAGPVPAPARCRAPRQDRAEAGEGAGADGDGDRIDIGEGDWPRPPSPPPASASAHSAWARSHGLENVDDLRRPPRPPPSTRRWPSRWQEAGHRPRRDRAGGRSGHRLICGRPRSLGAAMMLVEITAESSWCRARSRLCHRAQLTGALSTAAPPAICIADTAELLTAPSIWRHRSVCG